MFALRHLPLFHLKVLLRDMEQSSADSQVSKRSAEIHSGEVERARVSSAQATRKAELLCGISVESFKHCLLQEKRKEPGLLPFTQSTISR